MTDAVGAGGERWGAERLKRMLTGMDGAAPSAVRERLADALDEFQVGAQADDTALVVMRYLGKPPQGERIDAVSRVGA